MRNFVLLLFLITFSIFNCFGQEGCVSYSYYERETAANPSLLWTNQQIETFIRNRLFQPEPRMSPPGTGGSELAVFKIPVIVHILYNNDVQRISEEQVSSQIEALNRDFRRLNPVSPGLPDHFKSLAADCFVEFALASLDPQGKPIRGIVWKKTNNTSFGSDDRIKFSAHGGDDAWDSDRYLNIWVGNLSAGMIGYSSPLGSSKEKDGIVIKYTAFGTIGTATAPHHLGRIAVHETGHWLGLKHIWGDHYCGDDLINDTPPQKGPTRGCPTGMISSCDNSVTGSMYMNYMDITNDACTNLFTTDQRSRMRSLFAEGGPRHALLSSQGSSGPLLPLPVEAPLDTTASQYARIFPNPAVNNIIIQTGDRIGELLAIYNHLGQLVIQSRIVSNNMQLNISALKEGLYYMKVGETSKVLRFMKVN